MLSHQRVPTPLGKMRSSSRADSHSGNQKAQVGGAPEIDRTTVVNIKADVNLVQAEIDARSGHGGILELQHKMANMNWSPDPVATLQVVVGLQSLLLEKINELSRVCTAVADEQLPGGRPPLATSGTLSKKSKVGSIVAFFHNIDRRAELGGTSTHQHGAVHSGSTSPTMTAAKAISRSTSNLSKLGGQGSAVNNNSIPAVLDPSPREPGRASMAGSASQVDTDEDDGVCWTNQQGVMHGGSKEGSVNHPTTHSEQSHQPSHPDHLSQLSPEMYASREVLAPALAGAQAQESVAFLQRKIAVFTYLEKYVHELDCVDAALKAALHPALASLEIDTASLGNAMDPHLSKRLKALQKQQAASKGLSEPSSPLAGSSMLNSSTTASKKQPEPRLDGTQNSLDVGHAGGDHPIDSSKLSVEVRQLRNVVAFQSSLLSALADKVDTLKIGHVKELQGQDDKIKKLEGALREQLDTFDRERTFHNTRHDRAANLLLLERSRAGTPQVGSRPLSRITLKPGTPLPVNQKWKGENSSILHDTKPAADGAGRQASGGSGMVLAPLRRGSSDLPLVPTQSRDVAGEAQREYLRVIANQSDIIKDLAARTGSAESTRSAGKH